MEIRVVFTLVSILFIGICSGDNLVVKLHEGQIRGRTLTTNSLKTYYAFEDIPYATPPIGQLRFKPPQAHRGWTGILNTTKNEKMCIQFAENNIKPVTHIIQTEDCLVLNVYSPVSPNTQNKIPVLFWIHGGGLVYGHGGFYNPKYFMDYGVVVVTINYRLGPFGFLTTNNADIPGNNGLKDQVLALQWVQRNIGHFGGNPDQVTIFGESAGGVSVGYQILNRNAQNLFRAAIMQSGSALNNAYQPTPETPAFLMGKIINPRLNISTSSQLLAVLQNATTDSIIAAAGQVELSRPWRPIAENGNISGAIITAPMHESFIAGNFNRVPLLAGYNSEEVLTYFQNIPALRLLAESYDINPGRLISDNLNVADKLAVGTEIKALYTRGTFVADLGSLVRALSDLGFISGISKQAELTTNRLVPTYLFQFSYSGTARMYLNKGNISLPGAESVGHAEELFYMWDMGVPLTLPGDKLISTRLLTLFTNFVKTLNPTPTPDANLERITWQRASQMNLEYLNINGTLSMRSQPRNYQRVKEVYEKYIRPPLAVF